MKTVLRDWHDVFEDWKTDIGLDAQVTEGYRFDAHFDEFGDDGEEIPFGHFKGQRRWESIGQVPHTLRDQLFDLIVVQGDTEFASTEQQKHLVYSAPSEYDKKALIRVMREEMRHGYQMCHLLLEYFGESGKRAALAQLERRSGQIGNQRLLGAFNAPVDNWLDFFTYTEFVDRDGKYQLLCLSHSGFAPLGRSTRYMLKEESFHLGTGHTGLSRALRAGVIPVPVIQRYFNKWIPIALDLCGNDNSTSAHFAYERSLKGRPHEMDDLKAGRAVDVDHINEWTRQCYWDDICMQIARLNVLIPEGQEKLRAPDFAFGRQVGVHAGKTVSVTGEPLSAEAYAKHRAASLPTDADRALLLEIQSNPDGPWIAPRQTEPLKK